MELTPRHQTRIPETRPRKPGARFRGFRPTDQDEELLDQLEPPHRDILRASGSYREISESLNIPLGTVRSRMHRARSALVALRKQREPNKPN